MKKAIVIGAGIAGIASAIRLSVKGYKVHVFESNDYPGGKLSAFRLGAYRFDAGPSLFTMPQYVEELFNLAGKDVSNYFQYKKKNIICNYFYDDGTRFTAYSSSQKLAEEFEEKLGENKADVIKYLKRSKLKYDLTASLFLEKSLHKASTYISAETLRAVAHISKLGLNGSLNSLNEATFQNKKTVQFFNRFATYNGSSPYKTPGIMSMIPHLEQHFGTYFPKGGMESITGSLVRLAEDLGVQFEYETKVELIALNKNLDTVSGVKTKDKVWQADVVVSNMDIVPTYRKLLPLLKAPEKILKQERSSSALIFYWGIKKSFPELDLHNIFFSENYKEEFEHIFDRQTVYKDPTIYVNISSKEEPEDAPAGCENWFVMVNVPSNTGQDWDSFISETKRNVIDKLSKNLKEDIGSLIEVEEVLDPRLIESKTQSYQGALYGASSNNKFAAFLRHPNFKQSINGLYFCGGSVHPGGGIPLCLLSAKIVGDLVK